MSVVTVLLMDDAAYTFSWHSFAIGTFAGTLIAINRILIAIAVSVGIASCAQSIQSTHAVW